MIGYYTQKTTIYKGKIRLENDSSWFDEDTLYLRIADTGCGIPESALAHIYEPFFTTKKEGVGTGLGLSIVSQVVEDHHGTIQVESHVGKGTAFTVSFPRFFDGTEPDSAKS